MTHTSATPAHTSAPAWRTVFRNPGGYGTTQREIAEACGVTPQRVSLWACGHQTPRLDHLEGLRTAREDLWLAAMRAYCAPHVIDAPNPHQGCPVTQAAEVTRESSEAVQALLHYSQAPTPGARRDAAREAREAADVLSEIASALEVE